MLRSGRISFLGLSLSLVLLASPLAAQEEKKGSGKGGGPGGARSGAPSDVGESKFTLLRYEQVLAEVKVTPEQKTEIEKIQKELREQSATARTGKSTKEEREKAIENRKKAATEAEHKLATVLKPEQVKRLNEISFQRRGPQVLKDEAVAKELKLSAEQVTKVSEAVQWGQDERRKLMSERGKGKPGKEVQAERMEKMEKIQKDVETKVLAALTDVQKAQYEKMKGSPFKLDRSTLRGGQQKGVEKSEGKSSEEKKA